MDLENQAHTLFAQGDFIEAEALFRRITAQKPSDAAAFYNLGVTLAKLERFEEAMACYRAAIERNPAFADAYTNFGFCLMNAFNMTAQARQAFALARQVDPQNDVPVLNEGIAALALGDYAAGWQGFAARWSLPAYAKFKRSFDQPEWQGEDLAGRTLFLYAEQGFGDTVQMARFVPVLVNRGATVIVETQPALTAVLQSLTCPVTIISKGDPVPAFDGYAAMMDVPRLLQIRLETIPRTVPYLFADPEHVEAFRAQLNSQATLRVGLCWAGRMSHENDRNRSMSFAQLTPLLERREIEWISLQRLVPEGDRAALAASVVADWGQSFADFAVAAAAIEALDLVITVDTAIAHLAGALGKPVWVLLPFAADWRWLMQREDSPWYPTARLFRQQTRGDWDAVVMRVGESL